MHSFNVYSDAESVAQAAANYLQKLIESFLTDNRVCHIALPGGATPARCLELLAMKNLAWENVHFYLGDERCLPVGDLARNDTMIRDKLWSRIAIPEDNLHTIPAEQGAEVAAGLYAELLMMIGRLDIVVLGMGEDGHTASLFPNNPALKDRRAVVPVYAAPKPPAERVSLGLNTLRAAAMKVALVTGESKCDVVRQIKAGAAFPITKIGSISWFLDEAANG